MSALTDRQAKDWPRAVKRLNDRGANVPEPIASWNVHYAEEVRPGRGHFINAEYVDGEVYAQVLMDVYGYATTSFARLDWLHSDSNEECDCEPCEDERKDGAA